LKTTTFFWNVSDYLYAALSHDALERLASQDNLKLHELNEETFKSLQNSQDFTAVIWLYLLKRLTDLIPDPRHEVRNGAIQTILRIFDSHGDDLSPTMWQLCLDSILLLMITTDVNTYSNHLQSDDDISDDDEAEILKNKIGTTQVLLQGFSKLLADYLEPIHKAPGFSSFWASLTENLSKYLDYNLHDVTAAVYLAIDVILAKASKVPKFDSNAVETISSIWLSRVPASKSKLVSSSNIEAFEAYTISLGSIYRFRRDSITIEETAQIVNNLERCIRESESPSYTSDLDSLTALQSRVMRCLSMLRIDLDKATSLVLQVLGQFMSLPFQAAKSEKKTGLTYIALSKAAMDLVQKIVHAESNWEDILSSNCLELILSNLEQTIGLKYLWQRQGRSPPLWRKAVTTSVIVLESAIPRLFKLEMSQSDMEQYWKSIVGIFHNIAHAERAQDFKLTDSAVAEDEVFDIEALEKLNDHVIPALGSSQISDQVRRTYCRSLLTASIIHTSEPEEMSDLDTDPLGALYTIRFGRTFDPEPSERSDMAYFCFQALLALLQVQQSSPAQVRLAKAAAPYVILRSALPLKAYIADQPLRGKLPVPESQAYELVTMLRELRTVKCEPTAIPPTEKGVGQEGGHLVRLFPLIVSAARITTGPGEVKEELSKWLESLGRELGLPVI
jgi:C-terminal region of Mon2 protein